MRLRRRRFLGLASGACIGTSCVRTTSSPATAEPPSPPVDRWAQVRAQFDQDPSYANFAGFLLAPHPRPVREAIARHRDALDRNPVLVLEQQSARTGKPNLATAARAAAAEFIGVPPEEVALTDSTTMGLGLVYAGIRIAEGQEIVVGSQAHYSTLEALRLRAERDGVKVRSVELYADASRVTVDEVVTSLRRHVGPSTRVLGTTWVHSSTGVKMPLRAMADALAELNRSRAPQDRVRLVVDGVHGFGVENVTMAELGCDVFIAGCHKWILGPRGTGIVWARPEVWTEIAPTIPAFETPSILAWLRQTPVGPPDGLMHTPGGYHSFEHRWALPEAFAFQSSIGRAEIEARVHELNTRLKQGLHERPGIRLHTPMDPRLSSGITCFEVEGVPNAGVVEQLLERRIIASTSPYRVSYVRLAPGLLNDPRQVDEVLVALDELSTARAGT